MWCEVVTFLSASDALNNRSGSPISIRVGQVAAVREGPGTGVTTLYMAGCVPSLLYVRESHKDLMLVLGQS